MASIQTNVTTTRERRQMAALRGLIGLIASIPAETQAHFARVKDAHVLRAQFARLPDEALADLGMSAEEILSARSYNAVLPFFMQFAHGKRG